MLRGESLKRRHEKVSGLILDSQKWREVLLEGDALIPPTNLRIKK